MFTTLMVATLVVAMADWVAIAAERRDIEHVLKPLTVLVLMAALLSMGAPDPPTARWWVLAALVASLAGDVFLMLEDLFIPGLVSFLVAHLLYIVAFAVMGLAPIAFVVGAVSVAVLVALVGVRIVAGAAERDRISAIAVATYIGVISVMVAFAAGTTRWAVIVGAVLFYVSDAFIGWSRFVSSFAHQRLAIMTTYHLGQIGLVLGLLGVA